MTLTAIKVEPVYDPDARCWYAGEYSAKTLAALQAKLPEGSVIEGYYPEGYGSVVRPRVVVRERPWEPSSEREIIAPQAEQAEEAPVAELPEPTAVPTTLASQSPKRFMSSLFELEELIKVPEKDLGTAAMPAKLRPAPGRGKHVLPVVDWSEAEPLMIKMLEAGMSVVEVAEKLGTTRNAVIGRCHRRNIAFPSARTAVHAPKKDAAAD